MTRQVVENIATSKLRVTTGRFLNHASGEFVSILLNVSGKKFQHSIWQSQEWNRYVKVSCISSCGIYSRSLKNR